MAFVSGTPRQIAAALGAGAFRRFTPDSPLISLWSESNKTMGVDAMHLRGFTGKGRTIAVVDSGVDATHPDLAQRVRHNVLALQAPHRITRRVGQRPDALITYADQGPYSNTDAHNGHGTLVSGVLVADGTTGPDQVGVAPQADLIAYATGGYLEVVGAYDHILDHPEWGVDVVNNSFGLTYWQPFDPEDPVVVATKALTDTGVAMVFAAGNSGDYGNEMSMSGLALLPWVISVGSTDVEGARSSFSSIGLVHDNSQARPLVDGHARFVGDRVGIYHPTVVAPGESIQSTCSGAQTSVPAACAPGSTGTFTGTSVAAPQVAGLLALLRQASPDATVGQLRDTLISSARRPTDDAPFWQVGYGLVDGRAALGLLTRKDFPGSLRRAREAVDQRVLAAREWRVPTSDHWAFSAPAASTPALPDTRDFSMRVPATTQAIKIALTYAAAGAALRANAYDYVVTLSDAAGRQIATTTSSQTWGLSTAFVDLRTMRGIAFGDFRLHVEAVAASVPDPTALAYGDADQAQRVTLVAAQLQRQRAPGA